MWVWVFLALFVRLYNIRKSDYTESKELFFVRLNFRLLGGCTVACFGQQSVDSNFVGVGVNKTRSALCLLDVGDKYLLLDYMLTA